MAFDRNNPLYNEFDASSHVWPKYMIPDDNAAWSDGTAYIVFNGPRHSRGVGLQLETVWEYNDGSYTMRDIQSWCWDRSQVSPLCAAAFVAYLNKALK